MCDLTRQGLKVILCPLIIPTEEPGPLRLVQGVCQRSAAAASATALEKPAFLTISTHEARGSLGRDGTSVPVAGPASSTHVEVQVVR